MVSLAEVAQVRLDNGLKRVADKYGANHACKATKDFRETLADKRVDAVVIGTPDHWHAILPSWPPRPRRMCTARNPHRHHRAALETVKAARKHDIVYQVGSQQRTEFGGHFRKAVECIRNGRVGKVSKIKIGVGAAGFPCNLLPEKKPDGIDWDMGGPAPERAFSSVLCPPTFIAISPVAALPRIRRRRPQRHGRASLRHRQMGHGH